MRVIKALLRLLMLLLFSSFTSPSSSSVAVAVRVPLSPLRRWFADELVEVIRRESVGLLSAIASSSSSLAAPFAELAGGGEGGFHQN
jgi:hypothetical protein